MFEAIVMVILGVLADASWALSPADFVRATHSPSGVLLLASSQLLFFVAPYGVAKNRAGMAIWGILPIIVLTVIVAAMGNSVAFDKKVTEVWDNIHVEYVK